MPDAAWSTWEARLLALCDRIRAATRDALLSARAGGTLDRLARPVGEGAGDVTYGLDLPSEELLTRWLEESARDAPLSLLTEDAGWRHRGPGPRGGSIDLGGFDHGGPRIAIDPVDGTRNLMAELRSAWTVVSFAPAGPGMPRFTDLTGGLVTEIPTALAAGYRVLAAERGGPCRYAELDLEGGAERVSRELAADTDDRVDRGYFPIFRYKPDQRPAIARVEAAFFALLAEHEGADPRHCYDDQYISNGGQLVLLALGTYRCIFDPRALVAERLGAPTVTSKPYDVGGALICASAAGCALTAADGGAMDFPIDTVTPVHFAGYANAATRARLEPHWLAALAQSFRTVPGTVRND